MTFIFNVMIKESAKEAFIDSFEMMKTVPGFQSISIFQDQANPNKFTCVEFWDSKESHERHVKEIPAEVSDAWLELLAEPPQIGFYDEVKRVSIL